MKEKHNVVPCFRVSTTAQQIKGMREGNHSNSISKELNVAWQQKDTARCKSKITILDQAPLFFPTESRCFLTVKLCVLRDIFLLFCSWTHRLQEGWDSVWHKSWAEHSGCIISCSLGNSDKSRKRAYVPFVNLSNAVWHAKQSKTNVSASHTVKFKSGLQTATAGPIWACRTLDSNQSGHCWHMLAKHVSTKLVHRRPQWGCQAVPVPHCGSRSCIKHHMQSRGRSYRPSTMAACHN